jgi:hypothetical protein
MSSSLSHFGDHVPDRVDHRIRRLDLNHVAAVFDNDLPTVGGEARKVRLQLMDPDLLERCTRTGHARVTGYPIPTGGQHYKRAISEFAGRACRAVHLGIARATVGQVRAAFLLHRGQHFIELDSNETGGIIRHPIWDEQLTVVEQRTA